MHSMLSIDFSAMQACITAYMNAQSLRTVYSLVFGLPTLRRGSPGKYFKIHPLIK